MKTPTSKISKAEAISELWRRGELRFLCHKVQKEMYDSFYTSDKNSISVWLLGRQSGKSFLLTILALEQALRQKNSIIKLVTDTKLHVKSIFEKLFIEILNSCPEELKPSYKTAEYCYYFPNGSQIQLAGSDNKHYEKLRGQKSSLILVDEAGFCNDLDDMVHSVLMPTTTHTGGKIILASTPAEDPTHPFLKFIEEAELNGRLSKKTIDDNPLLTKEQVENIATKMGGRNSERFRREYLCELIRDANLTAVAEFNSELENEIVKEWPKPPHYDTYVSMDLGFKDLTAVLFGYYDFRSDKVIIEDEIPFNFNEQDKHLKMLSDMIIKKEKDLWTDIYTNEVRSPNARISDINLIVTNEIRKHSDNKLNFVNAIKDVKAAAVNNLRVMIANKKIIIHPRCTTLIRHLRNVRWNKNKDEFARSPDDSHYDFVDALIYMIRGITYGKNPYPNHYDLNLRATDSFYRPGASTPQAEVYHKIFNLRRK